MGCDYARHDYDERPSWATYLKPRTAQSRYEKAGDYGRVNPSLRSDAGGDPNAIAKGRATKPTVTPAIRSETRSDRV